MVLYVTRNGETAWNLYGKVQGKADILLNSKGIEQAKETMERFHYLFSFKKSKTDG